MPLDGRIAEAHSFRQHVFGCSSVFAEKSSELGKRVESAKQPASANIDNPPPTIGWPCRRVVGPEFAPLVIPVLELASFSCRSVFGSAGSIGTSAILSAI
jgi:hypothetical protein